MAAMENISDCRGIPFPVYKLTDETQDLLPSLGYPSHTATFRISYIVQMYYYGAVLSRRSVPCGARRDEPMSADVMFSQYRVRSFPRGWYNDQVIGTRPKQVMRWQRSRADCVVGTPQMRDGSLTDSELSWRLETEAATFVTADTNRQPWGDSWLSA